MIEPDELIDSAGAGPAPVGKRPWEVPTLDIRPVAAAETANSGPNEDGDTS